MLGVEGVEGGGGGWPTPGLELGHRCVSSSWVMMMMNERETEHTGMQDRRRGCTSHKEEVVMRGCGMWVAGALS